MNGLYQNHIEHLEEEIETLKRLLDYKTMGPPDDDYEPHPASTSAPDPTSPSAN
jgi:hypothetical protein